MTANFYHGTTVELAKRIFDQRKFKVSRNTYDWLGPGVYFYQDSPLKALAWAQRYAVEECAKGTAAAVIAVDIDLSSSFDIFRPENHEILVEVHRQTKANPTELQNVKQHRPVLRREDGERFHLFNSQPLGHDRLMGNNFVDAKTVSRAIQIVTDKRQVAYNCARYFFWEGKELYSGSYFFDHSNLQLCILGPDNSQEDLYLSFDDRIFLSPPRIVDFRVPHETLLSRHVRWPI
jgi:hypothetical protein